MKACPELNGPCSRHRMMGAINDMKRLSALDLTEELINHAHFTQHCFSFRDLYVVCWLLPMNADGFVSNQILFFSNHGWVQFFFGFPSWGASQTTSQKMSRTVTTPVP